MRYGLMLILAATMLVTSRANAEPFRCPVDTPEAERADQARGLFEEALQLEPGDPDAALVRLNCADKLVERAAVALRIGLISERLGRYDQAIAAFESYLERAGEAAPDRAEMEHRLAKLDRKNAEMNKPDAAPAAVVDPRPRLAGLIVAGVGGAAVIVGGALLLAAKVHSDEVSDIAPGTTEWNSDEASGLFDQALVEQGVGIAMLIGGGLLVGTGLGVAYWPVDDGPEAASLHLAPGGATLRFVY